MDTTRAVLCKLQIIQILSSNPGLTLEDAFGEVRVAGTNFPIEEGRAAIKELLDEGRIFLMKSFASNYTYKLEPYHQDTLHPQPSESLSFLQQVYAERARQVDVEGWTPQHDDRFVNHELAQAARAYAELAAGEDPQYVARVWWPKGWDQTSFLKPHTRERALVKSGALLLAEAERQLRIFVVVAQAKQDKG